MEEGWELVTVLSTFKIFVTFIKMTFCENLLIDSKYNRKLKQVYVSKLLFFKYRFSRMIRSS